MSVFKAKLQTYKSFFYKSLSYSAFMLLIASCTFEASITKTGQSEKTNNIILKLDGSPISAEINEGSSILLLISQSKSRTVATPLSLTIRSNQSDIASVFPDAVLNSPNEGVLQFSVLPNQTFANISIYTLHNLSFTGHRVYTLSFSTSDEAIVNELSDINLTVKDLETTPLIGFASASSSYNENAGVKNITVSLNPPSSTPVSVNYLFASGTATSTVDFSGTSGSLSFAPGETSKNISFEILDDVVVESGAAEVFSIQLSGITGTSNLGSVTNHEISIIDNDTENFSISNVSANEGSNITFTVSLSNASLSNLSVDYATSNGTALSGTHYTSSTGTLNFIAGETSKNISISTIAIPSEICAADRSFTMTLSNAVGASLAISSATGTIVDPDVPTISIANASNTEGSSVNFTVSLSEACSTKNIGFSYASSDGSAVASSDYTSVSTNGSIIAGNTLSQISVITLQDVIYEGSEDFTVTISSPTNATLGTATATGTINDDEVSQGAFTITGITGASDASADAYLNNGLQPIVSWQSSTNSTSYDVTIYENDGSTIKCATQNTSNTSLDLGVGCALSGGSNYKAKVTAKVGAQTQEATNNLYAFYTNQNPTLGSGGSGAWYVMAGGTITINAQWAVSPAVGVAEDADGDTLSFSTTNNGAMGTVTNNGSNLSYVAGAANYGADTFNVVISDGHGGSLSQTLTIHVMTAHTWTGNTNTAWSTANNWCGTIAANKKSCAGGGTVPGGANTAIFDGTCSSTNCSPTISANLNLGGLVLVSSSVIDMLTYSLTIGSSGIIQKNGLFKGGTNTINMSGPLNLNEVAIFRSTSGTIHFGVGIYTVPYTAIISTNSTQFEHNNGTVQINGYTNHMSTQHITLNVQNNFTFYNLKYIGGCHGSADYTRLIHLVSTNSTYYSNILNEFTFGENSCTPGNQHRLSILSNFNIYGNINLGLSAYSGDGVQKLVGTNNQEIISPQNGHFGKLVIDKSAGAVTPAAGTTNFSFWSFELISGSFTAPSNSFTHKINHGYSIDLYATNTIFKIHPNGNFIHNNGNLVFNFDTGSMYVGNADSDRYLNLSGQSVDFYNVTFNNNRDDGREYVFSVASGQMHILNNLSLVEGKAAGSFYLQKDLNISSTFKGGTAIVYLTGLVDQNLSSSCTGTALSSLVLSKTGGDLILNSNFTSTGPGPSLFVNSGNVFQSGFDLKLSSLQLNGNTLTKSGGSLVVNGSTIGTGSLFGGTIFDF